MIKLEIDEKFEELLNLYDLFENITRIDYVPLEYREEIKQLLIKAYKDGNQEFEKIHEKLKRLEQFEKENQDLNDELESVHHTYNELNQTNEELNNLNEKLIKAIEILKELIGLDANGFLETERQFYRLTIEEYDLLKEVLE